jgi:hypothetical protein
MTECLHVSNHAADCACTYSGCPRHAKCCECLKHHLAQHELPGCCFPPDVEKSYDRSFQRFVGLHGG